MTIELIIIFSTLIVIIVGILTYLVVSNANMGARIVALMLLLISAVVAPLYGGLIAGKAKYGILMTGVPIEPDVVDMITYLIDQDDDTIIYFWLIEKESTVPFYFKMVDVSAEDRKKLTEAAEQAEEEGVMLEMRLKGEDEFSTEEGQTNQFQVPNPNNELKSRDIEEYKQPKPPGQTFVDEP